MNDQANVFGPDFLRDSRFQHRRNNQVSSVLRDCVDNLLPRPHDTYADVMTAFGQFDQEPLTETIVRRGHKENAHEVPPMFWVALGWKPPLCAAQQRTVNSELVRQAI
jgi:hypothetical protein